MHHSSDNNDQLSYNPNRPYLQSHSAAITNPLDTLLQVPGIPIRDDQLLNQLLNDINGTYPQYQGTSNPYSSMVNNSHQTNYPSDVVDQPFFINDSGHYPLEAPFYAAFNPLVIDSGHDVSTVLPGAGHPTSSSFAEAFDFDPPATQTRAGGQRQSLIRTSRERG